MYQAGLLIVLCIGVLAQASKTANNIICLTNVTAVSPFKVSSLEGDWFQQAKLGPNAESQGRCVGAKYTQLGVDSIEVTVAQLDSTGKPAPITGTFKISSPIEQGIATGMFPGLPSKSYVIMKVDTLNYMVAFSCSSDGFSEVWIKSRLKCPPSLDAAYAVLKDYPTLTKDAFVPTDQNNCAPMVFDV